MWTEGRVIHFWEQFDKKLVWNSFLWKSNEDTPPLPNYSSLQCFLENAEIQKCKCFKKHCESEKMPLFCQIWTSKTLYQSRNTRLAKKHEIKSHAITNYRAVGIIWTFEVKWNFPTTTNLTFCQSSSESSTISRNYLQRSSLAWNVSHRI